jgi:hypothetical protein
VSTNCWALPIEEQHSQMQDTCPVFIAQTLVQHSVALGAALAEDERVIDPSHSLIFSQPGPSPRSKLVIATTSWRQSATNTSVRAWTRPRARTHPSTQFLIRVVGTFDSCAAVGRLTEHGVDTLDRTLTADRSLVVCVREVCLHVRERIGVGSCQRRFPYLVAELRAHSRMVVATPRWSTLRKWCLNTILLERLPRHHVFRASGGFSGC